MANKAQVTQKDKDIVDGYCRGVQTMLASQNQIIPRAVISICLLYYILLERFGIHANPIDITNNIVAEWIYDQVGTVYGIYNIANKSNTCFSWAFKLLSKNHYNAHDKYRHQIGIGIDNTCPKEVNTVWWKKGIEKANLYAITTTGRAISVEYGIKHDRHYTSDHYFYETFECRDEIKMELNTKKKTLIFYKNDEEFTYFRNITLNNDTEPYHMFISAENADAKIKLIDFKIIKLKS